MLFVSMTKKTAFFRIASLALTGLLLTACAQTDPQGHLTFPEVELTAPAEANYQTATVELGDLVSSVTGKLTVAYLHKADLSLNQSGARFKEALVKKKQEVKQGDILITFDTQVSEADLTELRLQRQRKWEEYLAGKEKRLAAIEAAKAKAQLLTSYDLQIANLEIEKLQAQYEQYIFQTTRSVYAIDDKIVALEEKANNNVLVAPFDGVIDSIVSFQTGDPVTSGKVLITMHATDTLLLQAKDAERLLRYNLPVTIGSGSKSSMKLYSGRVVAAPNILPVTISSDLVLVKFDEDITEDQLSKYLSFEANNLVIQNVLTVPKRAITRENGQTFVYVLEDDIIQKKYVVTRSDSGANAWVQEGLSAGQTLIID